MKNSARKDYVYVTGVNKKLYFKKLNLKKDAIFVNCEYNFYVVDVHL